MRLLLVLLALSVLCSLLCTSVVPTEAQAGYNRWRVFTKADGLADNFVLDIYQDRDGNLWFGTKRGVSRYNGSWETFTVSDGLGANEVWSIIEDNEGALWFATWGGGVTRYDGKEWQVFDDTNGPISREVRTITKDKDGSLWFGTRLGVSRYSEGKWESFTTGDGLVDNDVRAIVQDNHGVLWFGTERGVSTFDGIKWKTFIASSNSLIGNDVWTIYSAQDGALWFGTTVGVNRYDGDWESFVYIGLPHSFVYSIAEDTDGSLWFGGFGGVTQYNPEDRNWKAFNLSDRPFNETIRSVLIDRDGYLWIGTQGNGAGRYDKVTWTTFTEEDGLAGNEVTSAFLDREGGLWFGTQTGVSLYKNGLWKKFSVADGLANNFVVAITQDRERAMWFGTGGGVSRFDGENWVSYTTADGLATNVVRSILQDQEGNFWFGTFGEKGLEEGKGVSRFDGKDWKTFTIEDGLANNNVRYIIQDRNNDLWFGTFGGGVSRFDGSEWETIDYIAETDIRWILEDKDSSLWFAVWGVGVVRFDGDTWKVFNRDNSGLPNNDVISVFQDRDSVWWFSTALGGVTRYDGQEWYTFTSSTSGLVGNVIKPIIQDKDGNLWFGTWTLDAGVSRYSPNKTPPWVDVIRINDMLYDGNEVLISISAGLLTIELFGGDLYTDASDLVYFYNLEGVDSEWKRTINRFITYPMPNPGKYVFKVKVRDEHFNYSDPSTEVELVVAPPPPTPEPKQVVIPATSLPTPLPEILEVPVVVPVEPRYTIPGLGTFTLLQLLVGGMGLVALLGLTGLGVTLWRRRQPPPLPKEYFNPYIVGKPVTGRNFIGRADIFADLITALKGDNHLIVEGERRIGKTSLLYELAEALRQDGDYCFIPAYVQLQRVTEEKLFYAIMREIARESRRCCGQLPSLRCEAPYDDYDTFDAEDDLLAVIEALKETTDLPLRVVILLDEGDRLRDFTEETHSHLRGWMGADIQKDVLILVWCGVSFDRAWHQRTSPWYNQFRSAIELLPLSPQEARTLITRPVEGSYEYEEEAIERILTLSQRKPFVIQLVCHECVKRLWQEQSGAIITLADVDAVWPLVQRRLESDEKAEAPSEESALPSLTYPTAVPAEQMAEETAPYDTQPEETADDP